MGLGKCYSWCSIVLQACALLICIVPDYCCSVVSELLICIVPDYYCSVVSKLVICIVPDYYCSVVSESCTL